MRKHGVERRPWRSPTRKVVFTLTFARERKVFTQKIVQRSARAMSPIGTFETSCNVRSVVANGWKADVVRTAQFGRDG